MHWTSQNQQSQRTSLTSIQSFLIPFPKNDPDTIYLHFFLPLSPPVASAGNVLPSPPPRQSPRWRAHPSLSPTGLPPQLLPQLSSHSLPPSFSLNQENIFSVPCKTAFLRVAFLLWVQHWNHISPVLPIRDSFLLRLRGQVTICDSSFLLDTLLTSALASPWSVCLMWLDMFLFTFINM